MSKTTKQNEIWKSSPGEWVFCAFDNQPVAYYFNSKSVKVFGDSVVFTGRYPLKSGLTTQYVALSRPLGVSALGSAFLVAPVLDLVGINLNGSLL